MEFSRRCLRRRAGARSAGRAGVKPLRARVRLAGHSQVRRGQRLPRHVREGPACYRERLSPGSDSRTVRACRSVRRGLRCRRSTPKSRSKPVRAKVLPGEAPWWSKLLRSRQDRGSSRFGEAVDMERRGPRPYEAGRRPCCGERGGAKRDPIGMTFGRQVGPERSSRRNSSRRRRAAWGTASTDEQPLSYGTVWAPVPGASADRGMTKGNLRSVVCRRPDGFRRVRPEAVSSRAVGLPAPGEIEGGDEFRRRNRTTGKGILPRRCSKSRGSCVGDTNHPLAAKFSVEVTCRKQSRDRQRDQRARRPSGRVDCHRTRHAGGESPEERSQPSYTTTFRYSPTALGGARRKQPVTDRRPRGDLDVRCPRAQFRKGRCFDEKMSKILKDLPDSAANRDSVRCRTSMGNPSGGGPARGLADHSSQSHDKIGNAGTEVDT